MSSNPLVYSTNNFSKRTYNSICKGSGHLSCQFNYIKNIYDNNQNINSTLITDDTSTVDYYITSIIFGNTSAIEYDTVPLYVYYITTNYTYLTGYMTTLNLAPSSDTTDIYSYSFFFDYYQTGTTDSQVTSIFTPNILTSGQSTGITTSYGSSPNNWYTIKPGTYNVSIPGITTEAQSFTFSEVSLNGTIQTITIN
jgi:hypothetical protein